MKKVKKSKIAKQARYVINKLLPGVTEQYPKDLDIEEANKKLDRYKAKAEKLLNMLGPKEREKMDEDLRRTYVNCIKCINFYAGREQKPALFSNE